MFHTHLSLTVVDAAGGVVEAAAHRVTVDLTQHTNDGNAARDVLAHPGYVSLLTGSQVNRLSELVEICALGKETMPPELQADLSAALDNSEAVLTRAMALISALSQRAGA